ncbi:sterol carrier family protein [Corynebacterium breve]|uniref:Sterol carrier family protein n=1 Tax=Corynebacterium breve TaxID=3049799 RepID=A0ABY8VFA2_9CORY|nr:sterol carrier family protein [Corynebacterium breve]WIM67313.1 sterol carrier family protein [Corynebacterium breve]
MVSKHDPAETRRAVEAVKDWILAPENTERPARGLLANAVRRTVRAVEAELPGHTVELRVPPFVAIQCVEGPRHTRGTPPNVVEMDPQTWLRVATGQVSFEDALHAGKIDASGSRAAEITQALPVISF